MHPALADLRRTRRTRRLGELEWFEVAYKVYLAAILGGGAVIALSGLVGDAEATAAEVADVFRHGPAALGLVAVLAVALGVRSGADGGPVSLEPADVRHVLLAPIERREVLLRPYVQRLRAVAFGGAVAGAIAGQLAAQRLPGSPVAWATSGAAAGACVGALFVASAAIAHALAINRPVATAIGAALVAVQVGTLAAEIDGPGDTFGELALWGAEQHAVDLVAVAVTLAVCAVGAALVGRLRIDPLVRRGELVSQLRFAVTMQDLRTVVLLRRQLANELPRRRPWLAAGRGTAVSPRRAPWRRAWRGLARTPLGRLGRMTVLAAAAGGAAVVAVRGTTPAIVVVGLLLFLLGLDAIEPLSQEIDHPERGDGVPRERGRLHVQLLPASALFLVPFALVGAGVVALLEPSAAAAAFALAVPLTWLGAAGSVVTTVRDASPPVASTAAMMPPEFAGIGNTVRMLIPVAVSMLGALPVLAVREQPDAATVVRVIVGAMLVLAALAAWVAKRDALRSWWDRFVAGARMSPS